MREYLDAQFLISTHSPILLGLPGAPIFSFDDGCIHPIAYPDTAAFQITRRFVTDPASFLGQLLQD